MVRLTGFEPVTVRLEVERSFLNPLIIKGHFPRIPTSSRITLPFKV
jgi:hypothetical protein